MAQQKFKMKILIIRLMGLGDVASILIPAVKIIHQRHPDAQIDVLTYAAGVELMSLVPEVTIVHSITPEQWPNDLVEATPHFINIAEHITTQNYSSIINLDTWFMPCFLARVLRDLGTNVEGNYLSISVEELFQQLNSNTLSTEYIESGRLYIESTFPHIQDWFQPWWRDKSITTAYPQYYLNHCCGYTEEVNISLELTVESNQSSIQELFQTQTEPPKDNQKIIALSASGRLPKKQYKHAKKLQKTLEKKGYYVWSEFDGSVPMETTLRRFQYTNLLISVPTSTQWLAQLSNCPSLIIPGPLPPSILGAKLNVRKTMKCQYCNLKDCTNSRAYECLDIRPAEIANMVSSYLISNS